MTAPPRLKLADVRARYLEGARALPREIEEALRVDPRPGAQTLLGAIRRRRRRRRAEGQRLRHMLRHEQTLWGSGVVRVAGLDEAGMSPLAGPVVAAAVILPVGWRCPEVDDSKKLDERTRERLAEVVRREAVAFALSAAEPEEIDDRNIYHAALAAMRRAVLALRPAPEALLVDARRIPDVSVPQEAVVGGDGKSLSIAAASILAKTFRDARLVELDAVYPGFGFARHKGYPVAEHLDAIRRLGITPAHRRSFAPVRAALELAPVRALVATGTVPLAPEGSRRADLAD